LELTSSVIQGFSNSVLAKRFDGRVATPSCHLEWWELCCSKDQYVAIAAPRGHAKSTAITLSYTLACLVFRQRSFILIVSDTYEQAVLFLQELKRELQDNEDLTELFGVKGFPKESEGDFIVEFNDGYQARLMAKGSGQKVRGLRWNGKRPDLIVGDDLENDEIVMNQERREKFRNWVFGALIPCKSQTGIIRIVGTILHMDSFLERLMPKEWDKNTEVTAIRDMSKRKVAGVWKSIRYRAHNEDYSEILWPEKFTVPYLQEIRSMFVEQGNPEGYFQEYLNKPIDPTTAMFKTSDFVPMSESDRKSEKNYYIGMDLAVSTKERRDYSVFVVGGIDENGILHIVNVVRDRYDSKESVDMLFALQQRYKPVSFFIEQGVIEKSLGPFIKSEMLTRNSYPNIETFPTTKDKMSRARSINARMRSEGVKFDKARDWYSQLESELLTFPRDRHDDQVDALAWLGLGLDRLIEAPSQAEMDLQEWEEEMEESFDWDSGRSSTTGY
jgi:predicted phage terminase large subunit-like protein